MCKNANQSAASVMEAIEPTLKALVSFAGKGGTSEAVAAFTAFDAAVIAVRNWKPGTTTEMVVEAVNAFRDVFNTLTSMLPPQVMVLANIILAGVTAVLGIIEANSPAPAPPANVAAHPETQAMHAAFVAARTTNEVKTLVPHFERSIWHSPEHQYKKAWNDAVTSNNLPQELHQS